MLDTSKLTIFRGQSNVQVKNAEPLHPKQNVFAGRLNADTVSFQKTNNQTIAFGSRGKEMCIVSFTALQNPLTFEGKKGRRHDSGDRPQGGRRPQGGGRPQDGGRTQSGGRPKSGRPPVDTPQIEVSTSIRPPVKDGLAIQMKVRGVMSHQKVEGAKFPNKDLNVQKLAESKWKDGQKLEFEVTEKVVKGKSETRITLEAPGIGEIGYVHPEIAEYVKEALESKPGDFQFELSNVIAGTTKGAETTGLRVNLVYKGNDPKAEAKAKEAFSQVLNDPECADKVLLYQEKTSTEDVLKKILDYENKVSGPAAEKEMEAAINNIVKEIKNPENKNILLVGHCKPDGDTIGCVLGMKNAIALMDGDKKVSCAIDDKMPGLFRHKMPGIDGEMKRPLNPERVQQLTELVAKMEGQEQTEKVQEQLEILKQELKDLQNPENTLDPNTKYDLIIAMDIPTPKRFTEKFKPFFDNAKKIAYIDHHPHRLNEWQDAASSTGFDMAKVHENGLAWVADAVPAATQLVSIIGNRLVPALKEIGDGTKKATDAFATKEQVDRFKAYVASLVTGASTDTGQYTRTANLLPEHMVNPETGQPVLVQNRPNFLPEGMSKSLLDLTTDLGDKDRIDKKWLREEITWDLSESKTGELDESARDKMLKHAIEGKAVYPELSLGIIEASYDDMNQVWQAQREVEPDTTLLDIQNAFKYSEALGVLRANPFLTGARESSGGKKGDKAESAEPKTLREQAVEDYEGKYDNDRIAILVCQDQKTGELDEKLQIAKDNGLRLSLRSAEGSIHAELLANLFGGGGHGGAAGGRVDLPGVELSTPLAVSINGKVEKDFAKVLETLEKNYAVMKDAKIPASKQKALCSKIDIVKDDTGLPVKELIEAVVTEIRRDQPEYVPPSKD